MDLLKVLQRFVLIPAVSGYEKEMAHAFIDEIDEFVDCTKIDRIGNVIAEIRGTDDDPLNIMIFAHMDQLGFIIRRIQDDGFIQVDRLGGVPEKVLPGLEVIIRSKNGKYINGIIGTKSHHAASLEEKQRVDSIKDLYLDIGASSSQEVRDSGIEIGCPVLYKPKFTKLMGDMVCGTAIDDRGGCASIIKVASLMKNKRCKSNVYIVGTVWEEFNLRGAMMAARTINPDIAICMDVMLAGDTLDMRTKYETKLGHGPCIGMYSFHGRGTLNGTLPHHGLVELADITAKEENINVQYFAGLGILTDSSYLQLENNGVASIELGYATRYTHTPIEVCSVKDLEQLSNLAVGIIDRLDRKFDLNRY